MKKVFAAFAVLLMLCSTSYATCEISRFQTYNTFDNGFVNYAQPAQLAQPAIILPVLASHNNFVLAGQPIVIDQTIANIGYNNGFTYNSNTNFFVPLNSKKVVVDVNTIQSMKQVDANNATTVIETQNKGVLRGGLLQRLSNGAAGGKTEVVIDNNGNTFVRKRILP